MPSNQFLEKRRPQLERPKKPKRYKIDDFMRGYIEAALDNTEYMDRDGNPTDEYLSDVVTAEDLTDQALEKVFHDCNAFRWKNKSLLDQVINEQWNYTEKDAGCDFWLSRDGYAGFYEACTQNGYGPPTSTIRTFESLHTSAQHFRRVIMEVDDDGRVQQIG